MLDEDVRVLFNRALVNTPVVITTSANSFNTIAKQNGYTFKAQYAIPKIVKFEKTITILEKTNLYTQPNTNNKLGSSINPQAIKTFQNAGDFYLVDTWVGKRWIYAPKMVEGKIETYNKKVKLNEKVYLYHLPTKKNKVVSSLNPQNVEAVKRVGDWYQVKTTIGLKWLFSSKVSDLPKMVEKPKTPEKLILPKVLPFDGYITLFIEGNLYSEPTLSSKVVSKLPPQEIVAFEKAEDNWYHVQTKKGPLWVYSEHIVEGIIETIDEIITTTEYEYFYALPRDKKEINRFSPQSVKATAKIGNWYKVKTWMGEKWIQL
jgi:SH3-like domain-containing protein